MPTPLEYYLLAIDVYDKPGVGRSDVKKNIVDSLGWVQLAEESFIIGEDTASGLTAAVYEKNGEIIVAFRGFDNFESADWSDIYSSIVNADFVSGQVREALQFVRYVIENHPSASVSLAGHSLGGGIASAVSTVLKIQDDLNIPSYVFDSIPQVALARNAIIDEKVREGLPGLPVVDQIAYQLAFELEMSENADLYETQVRTVAENLVTDDAVYGDIASYLTWAGPERYVGRENGTTFFDFLGNENFQVVEGVDTVPLAGVTGLGSSLPFGMDKYASSLHSQGLIYLARAVGQPFDDVIVQNQHFFAQFLNEKLLNGAYVYHTNLTYDLASVGDVLESSIFGQLLTDVASIGVQEDEATVNKDGYLNTGLIQLAILNSKINAAFKFTPDEAGAGYGVDNVINTHEHWTSADLSWLVGLSHQDGLVAQDITGVIENYIFNTSGFDVETVWNSKNAELINAFRNSELSFLDDGRYDKLFVVNNDTASHVFISDSHSDAILLGHGDDTVWTEGGDDLVVAVSGENEIYTGDGDDIVLGGIEDDRIDGGALSDHLVGGNGRDVLYGGSGANVLVGDDSVGSPFGDMGRFSYGYRDVLYGGETGTNTFHLDLSDAIGKATNGILYVNGFRLTGHDRPVTFMHNGSEEILGYVGKYNETYSYNADTQTLTIRFYHDPTSTDIEQDLSEFDPSTWQVAEIVIEDYQPGELGLTFKSVEYGSHSGVGEGGQPTGPALPPFAETVEDSSLPDSDGHLFVYGFEEQEIEAVNQIVNTDADKVLSGWESNPNYSREGMVSASELGGEELVQETVIGPISVVDPVDASIDAVEQASDIRTGSGDDTIVTGEYDDNVTSSSGDDHISLNGGNDEVDAGAGVDTVSLLGSQSDYSFARTETGDVVVFNQSPSTARYRIVLKRVEFIEFSNEQIPIAIDELVSPYGTFAADSIQTSADNETIYSLDDADTIYFVSGNDVIVGGNGNDTIVFPQNSFDANFLRHEDGSVTVDLNDGSSAHLFGVEFVKFADLSSALPIADFAGDIASDQNDHLWGNNQSNQISAYDGNDFIEGRLGHDTLSGGSGSDVYIYNLGDGNDLILDRGRASDVDVIRLGAGILADEVTVSRSTQNSSNILLEFIDGGSILIEGQLFSQSLGIENIEFNDGTIWNRQHFEAMVPDGELDLTVTHNGTGNVDNIVGTHAEDVILGGLGDDVLSGDSGSDIYIYASGDGADTINENLSPDFDRLQFVDLNSTDIELYLREEDLLIKDLLTDQMLTIVNQFNGGGIEEIVFADSTSIVRDDLPDVLLPFVENIIEGTDGDENWHGVHFHGLTGTEMNDQFQGHLGEDILLGGIGSDVYLYELGDGKDFVSDHGDISDLDIIKLGAGISTNNVTVQYYHDLQTTNGVDLSPYGVSLVFSDGGSINISGQLGVWGRNDLRSDTSQHGIERVQFHDGNSWDRNDILNQLLIATNGDDILYGSDQDDTVSGGVGNDELVGRFGSDTYIYNLGDGHDIVQDRGAHGDLDILRLGEGITTDNFNIVRSESDGHFGSGTTVFLNFIDGGSIQLAYQTLSGTSVDYGIEAIEFADGTVWDQFQLDRMFNFAIEYEITHEGTDAVDQMYGSNGADVISGNEGDDKLYGDGGSDVYLYREGDGSDYIRDNEEDGSEIDTLYFADLNLDDVILSQSDEELRITIVSTGDVIRVEDQFGYSIRPHYGIERIKFADGSILDKEQIREQSLVRGTDGNDNISGGLKDDYILGGLGDDVISGGSSGADRYIYRNGDGSDTISDFSSSDTQLDVLDLRGLNVSDVVLTQDGHDLLIEVQETDHVIRVRQQFYSSTLFRGVDLLEFSDGTVWERDQIRSEAAIRGTNDNDHIEGTSAHELFRGGDGDDVIDPGRGNDIVYGGEGNDYIYANSGADAFYGESGVDTIDLDYTTRDVTLDLSQGLVTFDNGATEVVSGFENAVTGIGDDTIIGTDGDNVLQSGLGDDIVRAGAGNDFVFANSGADSFDGGDGVDTIDFTYYTRDVKVDLAQNIAVFNGSTTETVSGFENVILGEGDDVFIGNSANNVVTASGGDDVLSGGSGSDIYRYDLGDGSDTIIDSSTGADVNILEMGHNILPGSFFVSREADDAILTFLDQSSTIRLSGQFASNEAGVEEVRFIDGTIWGRQNLVDQLSVMPGVDLVGTDTNDTIVGTNGEDTFIGGLGDDYLQGKKGTDTYVYNLGDGNDEIYEFDTGRKRDIIKLGEGITPDSISVERSETDSDDLILRFSDGGSIYIQEQLHRYEYYRIEEIQFADGTVWDDSYLEGLI